MNIMTTIIINPASGPQSPKEQQERLQQLLRNNGLDADIRMADSGSQIQSLVREAIEGGSRRIVAGGGDGTINAVAGELAGSDLELGVLPLGTFNHFAKDLNIPLDLEGAVANLATGIVRKIDAAEVNGRLFINNSSLGLYPSIVKHREQQQERLGRSKGLALVWATLAMLGRYPQLHVKLELDGTKIDRKTPLVFIGNNDYELQGFSIGERRALDTGELCIYIPHKVGRLRLFWLTMTALLGSVKDADDFDAMHAREVTIETRRKRVRVAVDGEVVQMQAPLRYRICRKALNVVTPEMQEGGSGSRGV